MVMQLERHTEPATELVSEESSEFTPEITRFLESIVWGSQGVKYRLHDLAFTVHKVPSPQLFLLRKHQRLIGTYMLISKPAGPGDAPLPTQYFSMMAIEENEQGKGYGKLIARYGLSRQRELLGSRGLMYAYVEEGNDRSRNLLKSLGYAKVGQFHAMAFGRLFPRHSIYAAKLHPYQVSAVKNSLRQIYDEHALADIELSFNPGHYWVLMEKGGVIAGAQVETQRWEIASVPGPGGFFAQRVLPYIPVLNTLFNPKDFRFLKLSHVFFQPGRAAAAVELVEALLARAGVNAALMYWDKRSPVYQAFAAAGPFGLLNTLAETPVNVLGMFHGLNAAEIARFCRQPMAISPIDI